jgi:DNA-binding MarR family transcriptional regulator
MGTPANTKREIKDSAQKLISLLRERVSLGEDQARSMGYVPVDDLIINMGLDAKNVKRHMNELEKNGMAESTHVLSKGRRNRWYRAK